jgi:E3 ubiquitin-protein ligase RNF144
LSKMDSKEESKLNEDLIKKLQEEDRISQRARKKIMEEKNNVPCKICLDDLTTKSLTVLNECGHVFHADCLGKFAKLKIEGRELPIRCPEPDCKMELQVEDLEQIVEEKLLEKFREFALKHYLDHSSEEVSWCPTANCPFVFINDDKITDFLCPVCKKRYCFECKVLYHHGQTCKEYRINNVHDANDDKFMKLIKSKKYKQCPKCKFWIEKKEGCNNMVCRCGFSFCYGCGKSPCGCGLKPHAIPFNNPRYRHGVMIDPIINRIDAIHPSLIYPA